MAPARFIFIILGMLLITISLVAGLYINQAAGKYFTGDTLLIYGGFYADDKKDIKIVFPNAAISSRSQLQIVRGSNQVISPVIFCDAKYFAVHFMAFIEGGPWHESENNFPVIILNENLAWQLFGGFNVIGLEVRIGEKFYQIVGIARQGESPMAWLPISLNPNMPVTSVYVIQYPYNPVDGPANARFLLEGQLFRNADNYVIIDLNRYIESIEMRFRILVYGIWLYILILMIIAARKNRETPKIAIPLWIGVVVCIAILTGINDILQWLPTIADSNISVFSSLSNSVALPSEWYLSHNLRSISRLNRYANFVWMIGAIGFFSLIAQLKH